MKPSLIGVIPAAGSGVRALPYTYEMHKGMFEIDGQSNIERLIVLMRDQIGIQEIVIVLGYMGDTIKERFGSGEAFGVKLHYLRNQHLDKGWAWSVLLAKPYLADRHACVMLSDEFYLDTNHKDFQSFDYHLFDVVVATKRVGDSDMIKRNFSVEKDEEGRVIRLVENPRVIPNNILGMGNFILSPKVFDALEDEYQAGRPSIDFVNYVDELIVRGSKVTAFDLEGEYINLNDVSSLESAQDLAIRKRLQK